MPRLLDLRFQILTFSCDDKSDTVKCHSWTTDHCSRSKLSSLAGDALEYITLLPGVKEKGGACDTSELEHLSLL